MKFQVIELDFDSNRHEKKYIYYPFQTISAQFFFIFSVQSLMNVCVLERRG